MKTPNPDPASTRRRIARYEKILAEEKLRCGSYGDGYGKRYLLGPLYLLAGDLGGALRHFRWFEKEFSDDSGDPAHALAWALACHRAGDIEGAEKKLRQAMLCNLYIVPRLLGRKIVEWDIWHGSNMGEPSWLDYIPEEWWRVWTEGEKTWAARAFDGPALSAVRDRYVAIHKEFKTLPPGPRRSRLAREASRLSE